MTYGHPKLAVGLLATLIALAFAATGTATTFVTRHGTTASGPDAAWASQAHEPTVLGQVQVWPASLCGGAAGCSEYYTDVQPRIAVIHAADRDIFYFEMGHLFDYEMLTWPERGLLAHVWGVYGHRWNNSFNALQQGQEDGLTADFAAVYASCAEGTKVSGLQAGEAPSITVRNTCSLIRAWA